MINNNEEQDTGKIDMPRLLHITPQQYAQQLKEDQILTAIQDTCESDPEEFAEFQPYTVDRERLKQVLSQAMMAQQIIDNQQQQIETLQQLVVKLKEALTEDRRKK